MAIPHAKSGDLIDVRPLGASLRKTISTTLVSADDVEVFRLVLPAGEQIPDHKMPRTCELPGVVTIQCLEGEVEINSHGRTQALRMGHMVYLASGEPHALKAIKDSSVLVTTLVQRS